MVSGSKMRCRHYHSTSRNRFNVVTYNICFLHILWKYSWQLKRKCINSCSTAMVSPNLSRF